MVAATGSSEEQRRDAIDVLVGEGRIDEALELLRALDRDLHDSALRADITLWSNRWAHYLQRERQGTAEERDRIRLIASFLDLARGELPTSVQVLGLAPSPAVADVPPLPEPERGQRPPWTMARISLLAAIIAAAMIGLLLSLPPTSRERNAAGFDDWLGNVADLDAGALLLVKPEGTRVWMSSSDCVARDAIDEVIYVPPGLVEMIRFRETTVRRRKSGVALLGSPSRPDTCAGRIWEATGVRKDFSLSDLLVVDSVLLQRLWYDRVPRVIGYQTSRSVVTSFDPMP